MQKLPQCINLNEKQKVQDRLFVPSRGVTLKEGLLKTVFDNNIGFLKTLDLDAMLYWFRKRAGKPAPGVPYHGHFEDNIKGQTAGLFLMGAGNTLRWHKEEELEKIMNEIVDCIDACRDSDGYLMAISKDDFGTRENPHYVRIWLNYGLIAAAMGGNGKAYQILREWQDWFNQCDDLPIIRYTELSFQGIVASTAAYNTPVGKWDDMEVAIKYYQEDWRLGQFIGKERDAIHIRRQPGYEPHPHGTELESFEGYLDLYRATGKKYYLRAVLNAYDLYKEDWQHVGGGIVMCEHDNTYPKSYWISPRKKYNEFCCTAFWIQLNQRLHRLFPDEEKYVNEIEASLYNIAVADQDGTEGIRYFAILDQHKTKSGKVTCCCGVGTKVYGTLPEYLYSVAEDGVYVDIYAASQFNWEKGDHTVTLDVDTKMPYDENVSIKISMPGTDTFKLRLRIPAWVVSEVEISINGKEKYVGSAGSYCEIERTWENGDVITFRLPMAFRIKEYSGADDVLGYDRYSFEYGPILMAIKGEVDHDTCVYIDEKIEQHEKWLLPGDRPLAFRIKSRPDQEIIPYFEIQDERFTCFPLFKK